MMSKLELSGALQASIYNREATKKPTDLQLIYRVHTRVCTTHKLFQCAENVSQSGFTKDVHIKLKAWDFLSIINH
jgi:hypothetical protein